MTDVKATGGRRSRSLDDNVGVRIIRIAEVFARLSKSAIEDVWGLRNVDLRVLNVLDGGEKASVVEIARRTHIDKGWVSRAVQRLSERKLVNREYSDPDSRYFSVVLSPAGRDLLDRIRPAVERGERAVLEGIDEAAFKAELDRLLANLERIVDASQRRTAVEPS
jgi:DNA-binding MarR family transcriptional regulator